MPTFIFVFHMITFKKTLSALLVAVLLVAVTGVSFSKHICLSGKTVTCAKSNKCCKDKHSDSRKNNKCCTVQDFYFKANIVSTHDKNNQKAFSQHFISVFQNHFFIPSLQTQCAGNDLCYKPPLLRSSRSILLDSSRLTI